MNPKINIVLLILACTAGCACARLGDAQPRQLWAVECKNDGHAGARCGNDCNCKGRCIYHGPFSAKCSDGEFGQWCSDKSHCNSGHCIRFECADGTEASTCDNNGQCYADDCAGSACFCNAGKCKKKLPVDAGCNDGSQCSSDSCIRFRCADAELGSTCDFNHQCKGSDTWCNTGRCATKLPEGDGCNDGSQCSSGACIRFKCSDGTVGATCDKNSQCNSGNWCDSGNWQCKVKFGANNVHEFCNDGSQCASGNCIRFRCADGKPGATCDNNQQCYSGVCKKDGNCFCDAGKCKTALPWTEMCVAGDQCQSTKCEWDELNPIPGPFPIPTLRCTKPEGDNAKRGKRCATYGCPGNTFCDEPGGLCHKKFPNNQACKEDDECESGYCKFLAEGGADACAPTHCGDGKRNGDETDVDCGGKCQGCGLGKKCGRSHDCESFMCWYSDYKCHAR